ncbi:hypothetical protein [Shewanella gaetbuli]|uniref:Solute-binding protein family 3/N-terminal domain-containing protein n=1 Tax=Shewanella gaetbuli TaxID=220752 RepID=A0A9X1ZTE9_9GAMM|nr:hypothetical protein [Shewanella gaetbuli]MCL1141801.1 hypothetical protein [Shewanella gaetbuli]
MSYSKIKTIIRTNINFIYQCIAKLIVCVAVVSTLSIHALQATSKQDSLIQEEPMQGILLAETDSTQSDLTQYQPLGMFAILLQLSDNQFHFEQKQASYSRSWSDLNKLGNACMYNKFKSPEREAVAYFSQKPITVYPPLRLIVLKKNTGIVAEPVDLENLPALMAGHIGVVSSRSYGEKLDHILAQQPQNFYVRSGMNSTNKLIEMLIKERVLGVIEYSAEASLVTDKIGISAEFHAIPIKGVLTPDLGYMACSKTPQGKALVGIIDQVMATDEFKKAFINEHNSHFNQEEQDLLKPEIDRLMQW